MIRLSAFTTHDQHIAGTKYYRSRNFITRVRTQKKDCSVPQAGLGVSYARDRTKKCERKLMRILTRLKLAVERDLVCFYGSAEWL